MIPDFIQTVEQDMFTLFSAAKSYCNKNKQDKKVNNAALRVIAAFGIGLTVCSAISAIAAFPVLSPFALGLAALMYTIFHDLFVIAKNDESQTKALGIAKGMGNRAMDALSGEIHNSKTAGTFHRPIWNQLLKAS